ncbi:MAG: peptidase [Hyphomicrobiales bacterium]|nr:peptidase [Hyphomicrobiales bacterium]
MRPSTAMLALIAAAFFLPVVAVADERPVMSGGRAVPQVQGVWRSRGYGYVVRFDGAGRRLYHIAGDHCWADPLPQGDPSRFFTDRIFAFYRPLADNIVAFSRGPGRSHYVFDRLAGLPAACADQTAWTPARIAAAVAAIFTDLYPSLGAFGIDWPARLAALERRRGSIVDDASLFDAVRDLLAGIDDAHVELHATVAGSARELVPGDGRTLTRVQAAAGPAAGSAVAQWRQAYRRGVLETVLEGKGHETANGRMIWGRVGDVGYINLLTLYGWSTDGRTEAAADAAFDQAFAAFAGVRAVVVDVSSNTGGSDPFALHVAGRFADQRRHAFSKVGFGARGVPMQELYVEPSPRPRYLGPVHVLMSDPTVSAGEIFALAMHTLPHVVLVGGPTRGAFSDAIDKPLPNGWKLNLSAEIYLDPQGRSHETKGLPPQVARELFPADDLMEGHARVVRQLITEIAERDSRRPR